jgi:hypothetical protein
VTTTINKQQKIDNKNILLFAEVSLEQKNFSKNTHQKVPKLQKLEKLSKSPSEPQLKTNALIECIRTDEFIDRLQVGFIIYLFYYLCITLRFFFQYTRLM